MIYFSGIDSFIETAYLEEELDTRIGASGIVVNPENVSYLTGKTIIINILDYPVAKLEAPKKNNCTLISRITGYPEYVNFQPYILKPEYSVIWNGRTVEWKGGSSFEDLSGYLFEEDLCSFDLDKLRLYFPKIRVESGKTDQSGNLTCLGWALQQIGVNVVTDTPFVDLDILKTKKMQF